MGWGMCLLFLLVNVTWPCHADMQVVVAFGVCFPSLHRVFLFEFGGLYSKNVRVRRAGCSLTLESGKLHIFYLRFKVRSLIKLFLNLILLIQLLPTFDHHPTF